MLTFLGDDNWDDDFASAISPSALYLPQFKPHDNFGGLLSSDRLKAFASLDMPNDENDNWDHNFEGDLVTIKPPRRNIEPDTHELETIRPYRVKPTVITQEVKPAVAPKSSPRKTSTSAPPRPKSPVKAQAENKFLIPHKRPSSLFREQSVEDYSDLCVENDSVFDRRLNVFKVCISHLRVEPTVSNLLCRMMYFHLNYFIPLILLACLVQPSLPLAMDMVV